MGSQKIFVVDLYTLDLHRKNHSCIHLQLNGRRNTGSSAVDVVGDVRAWQDKSFRERLDDVNVDASGTTERWDTNVKQEESLEQEVEWDPVQDSLGPELNHVQEGEHNPVSQQLSVIVLTRGLQRNEGEVTWNNESSNVGQELTNTTEVQENQQEVNTTCTQDGIGSWQSSQALKLVQTVGVGGLLLVSKNRET